MEQKLRITPDQSIPMSELQFRFSRSGGAGGQNVNKVSSRVELVFDVNASSGLTQLQKDLIAVRLQSRINTEGFLTITSQESRSQWKNREIAIDKFIALISKALKQVAPRIATKSTRAARERRLKEKRVESKRKQTRRRPDVE